MGKCKNSAFPAFTIKVARHEILHPYRWTDGYCWNVIGPSNSALRSVWEGKTSSTCSNELYGQKPAKQILKIMLIQLQIQLQDTRTAKRLETSYNVLFLTPERSPVHWSTGDRKVQKNGTRPRDCVTKFKIDGTSKTMSRRRPTIATPPPLCFLPSIGRITWERGHARRTLPQQSGGSSNLENLRI